MLKVILTKGLPASGKTTWAKEQLKLHPNAYKRVNKDDLRAMLDDSKYSSDAEKFILKVRDLIISEALANGKHVIVDDTNLAPKHTARIKQLIHGKAELQIWDFTSVTVEECIKRDLKRCNSVGEKVIKDMYKQFLKPPVEIIPYNPELGNAVICDLDGTLAILNDRSPYDASTCENDTLNPVVSNLLDGKDVIIVSGREDKYKEQTEKFLSKHGIEHIGIFMRKSDDTRKDAIIKREIFDNEIRGKFNITFVLDDRNQVVEMWRDLGLVCLQVADGDF